MAREFIYKGGDKKIELTISNDGEPLDLTTLAGYIVVIYNKLNNNVVQKYSKNAATGYKDILVTNAPEGIIQVNLQVSEIANLSEGTEIDAEIKTQVTDAAFENSTFQSLVRGIEIGVIKESISKTDTSLA
jgi:hypothetical protein